MIDVTDGTNVDVGLGTLESSGQSTDSHLVAGEDMVDGVDGTRAQQGSPAGARQNVQGTGDARHLAIKNPKTIKNGDKQQEGRSMEDTTRGESTAKFSGPGCLVINGPIRGRELRRSVCHQVHEFPMRVALPIGSHFGSI